jgi:thiaminase
MSDKSSFSERMRIEACGTWNAILGHRFFREVATDAIDDRVFARYLRIEYGFVDTAARTLGYAVAKAPSFQERRRLGLGLYGLVTDQETFFIDAFERMGRPTTKGQVSRRRGSLFRCTRSFSRWRRRRATRRSSPALWRRNGCI